MLDILNLRNGMEDNLLLIQQIHLMIQKEGKEQKGFNDVIHAAQQHIDAIITVYAMGVSWLKDDTDFALSFIQGLELMQNHNNNFGREESQVKESMVGFVALSNI